MSAAPARHTGSADYGAHHPQGDRSFNVGRARRQYARARTWLLGDVGAVVITGGTSGTSPRRPGPIGGDTARPRTRHLGAIGDSAALALAARIYLDRDVTCLFHGREAQGTVRVQAMVSDCLQNLALRIPAMRAPGLHEVLEKDLRAAPRIHNLKPCGP